MKIKEMTATFGSLEMATLKLNDGLNVFSAPNESGKSTWAGFLRAMLYGIDTRERDKAGFLADKNRFQPWSGAPMAGRMQVEWQGQDVVIRRFPNRSGPFGGFEAVYAATGDPVPGLTAANVGEQLTGAGKEVYLRSAFVGQGGAAISPSGELEARISALATSGQEDVAWSAVERTLKDWRNHRRANRAKGLIPELEGELSGVEQDLRDGEQARSRSAEARENLERLQKERAGLEQELAVWERIERHQLNRRYAQAMAEWEKARAACGQPVTHPIFDGMTGEEAWAYARKKQAEREEALTENRRRKEEQDKAEKRLRNGKQCLIFAVLFAVCAVAFIGTAAWLGNFRPLVIPTLIAGTACALFAYLGVTHGRSAQAALKELAPLKVPEEDGLLSQAADYREALARGSHAQAAADAAKRRADDLYAQGGRLADTLELLHTPERSRAELTARLGEVRLEINRWQRELDRAEGALAQLGGPEEREARKDELERLIQTRTEEYDALTVAMEALSAANEQLRARFSPAVNRTAGEILSELTGGRYSGVTLARDFSAQAMEKGEVLPRTWLALSTGTAEQLYLAVRLAVCRLTLPGAPILLDDALAAFDDERMALALEYLKKMGEERQILLFSCHRRETEWAEINLKDR